jgi:hypothetical protein
VLKAGVHLKQQLVQLGSAADRAPHQDASMVLVLLQAGPAALVELDLKQQLVAAHTGEGVLTAQQRGTRVAAAAMTFQLKQMPVLEAAVAATAVAAAALRCYPGSS